MIGFEGLYQAGNLGGVRSLDRVVRHNLGGPKKLKGRILQPGLSSHGYLRVNLSKNGIVTNMEVHRVVAAAWIGPCPDGMEVCHGPNGKLDNSVSNLRYDTRTNNNLDKRRDGTDCGKPVRRSDGVEFISMRTAAEKTGCNHQSISMVCKGRQKTAGSYGWKFI